MSASVMFNLLVEHRIGNIVRVEAGNMTRKWILEHEVGSNIHWEVDKKYVVHKKTLYIGKHCHSGSLMGEDKSLSSNWYRAEHEDI